MVLTCPRCETSGHYISSLRLLQMEPLGDRILIMPEEEKNVSLPALLCLSRESDQHLQRLGLTTRPGTVKARICPRGLRRVCR